MSVATERAYGAIPAPAHPRLRVLAPVQAGTRRLPFVVVVCGLLTVGLLGLLAINTFSAQDAFRLHDLQQREAGLADTEQALALAVAKDSSPANLAARAQALGMVPSGVPGFVRLRDGRLLGAVTAAPTPPPARPAPKPSPATAASPAAHPTKPASAKPAGTASPATAGAARPAASPAAHPAAKAPAARPTPTPTPSGHP